MKSQELYQTRFEKALDLFLSELQGTPFGHFSETQLTDALHLAMLDVLMTKADPTIAMKMALSIVLDIEKEESDD